MADVTVSQFAEVLKVPVERLLTQLDEAGIQVSGANDLISDDAKMELLTFLRRSHGRTENTTAPPKITLKRKSQGEIKVASSQGRARMVNVEVRSKKTYLNRSVLENKAAAGRPQAEDQLHGSEQPRRDGGAEEPPRNNAAAIAAQNAAAQTAAAQAAALNAAAQAAAAQEVAQAAAAQSEASRAAEAAAQTARDELTRLQR